MNKDYTYIDLRQKNNSYLNLVIRGELEYVWVGMNGWIVFSEKHLNML